MKSAEEVFFDYAAAFEQTYQDDDWERLRPFFDPLATYAIEGGPLACRIKGVLGILMGMKKSVNGLDRRCDERQIEVTDGPVTVSGEDGDQVQVGWKATYTLGEAPREGFAGRSVATIRDGRIVLLVDQYDEQEMERFGKWQSRYGPDLDGSYI